MTTSRNRDRPSAWEIWLAYLHFADHPETGKVRPIVVIDSWAEPMVVCKVTSAASGHYPTCELADWNQEGLERPSRVQVEPLFELSSSDLLKNRPLGKLSMSDRTSLQQALNQSEND